ncbi:glycoprotein [Wenling minipizza batfish hantavirus]|uniref:Glycoprotein n=1 Tax=Wenling minipizza batfish hantavirus TaxID=2116434 RepID=A0A2P1GNS8_9VIRU|nr:glycoprotein [Wenling minipizza batfish hantavirus]
MCATIVLVILACCLIVADGNLGRAKIKQNIFELKDGSTYSSTGGARNWNEVRVYAGDDGEKWPIIRIGGDIFSTIPTSADGTEVATTYDGCFFPCFLGEPRVNITGNKWGEIGSVEAGEMAGKFSGFYGGMIDQRRVFKTSVCYPGVTCLSGSRENGQIELIDFEGEIPKDAALKTLRDRGFLGQGVERHCWYGFGSPDEIEPLGVLCSANHYAIYDQNNVEKTPGACLTNASVWTEQHMTLPPTRIVYAAISMYGYKMTGDPRGSCTVRGKIRSVVPGHGIGAGCSVVKSENVDCQFSTPIQQYEALAKTPLGQGSTGIMAFAGIQATYGSAGLEDQNGAELWETWGRDLTGGSSRAKCQTYNITRYDGCRDVVWMKKHGVYCRGVGPHQEGNVGAAICELRCEKKILIRTCTRLQAYMAKSRIEGGAFYAEVRPEGLWIKTAAIWARVNEIKGDKCSRWDEGLFCQTLLKMDDVTALCGEDGCRPVVLVRNIIVDKVGPVVHPNRVARALGGTIALKQNGGYLQSTSWGIKEPYNCRASGDDRFLSWTCTEEPCEELIDPRMFGTGETVTIACGKTVERFTWAYGAWNGFSSKNIYLDATIATLLNQPWWIIGITVMALIWLIRFVFTMFSIHVVIAWILARLLKAGVKLIDLPRVLLRHAAGFLWFWRKFEFCATCGADINTVTHAEDGTCQTSSIKNGCHFCPTGKATTDHWTRVHLKEHVPWTAWVIPLSWEKYFRMLSKPNADRNPETRRGKGGRKGLMALALIGIVTCAKADIIPAKSCEGKTCTIDSTVIMEGLWPGDSQCYTLRGEGLDKTVCLSLESGTGTLVAPVVKCRLELDVRTECGIYCLQRDRGCRDSTELADRFPGCPVVYSEEVKYGGGYDWGCGLPNLNSDCFKAVAVSNGKRDYCLVDPNAEGAFTSEPVMCMIVDNQKVCSRNATTVNTLTILHRAETSFEVDIDKFLSISPEGEVRRAVDPDGCYKISQEKMKGNACDTGIDPSEIVCQKFINHWWDCGVHCQASDPNECTSPFKMPLFMQTGCRLGPAVENVDENSMSFATEGCTRGGYKLTWHFQGTVERQVDQSTVTAIEVKNCAGESGIDSQAHCDVDVSCTGPGSCHMDTPIIGEIPCLGSTRVDFTQTTGQTVIFRCGGFEVSKKIDLDIISADHFKSANSTSDRIDDKIRSQPWWVWFILAIAILVVILGLIACSCIIRAKREYTLLKER